MGLTKANSDVYCYSGHKNPIVSAFRLFIYRVNIWIGSYVLEPGERVVYIAILAVLLRATFFCTKSFLHGFMDGLYSEDGSITEM